MSAQLSFQAQPIVQFRPRRLSLPTHTVSLLPAERMIHSEALLKGQREILIQHGDRIYRLRHTSNDKLILTK